MDPRNEPSRITIEISKEQHRKLKARAAILGKSMKEVVIEALEAMDECLQSSHIPNKATARSIKNIEEGKDLTEVESVEALFKKMGL